MVDVGIVQVKPAMLGEWEALQKELVAEMKKAGAKAPRQVYQTIRGNNFEYHVVRPRTNWAEFDTPDTGGSSGSQQGWFSRVFKCIDSREALVAQVMKEHSNPPDTPAPMTTLITFTIAPGKLGEFDELVKSKWVPLRRKLGLAGPVEDWMGPIPGRITETTVAGGLTD